MAIDRELIASALFRVVSASANFTTINRRLRHWADVAPGEQPALFMSERGGEGRSERSNLPVLWTLNFDLFIYTYSSDPYLAPAILLNPLIDSVERALSPTYAPDGAVTGYNQLGLSEMVRWARVMGRIETDEGVLGDQAMAIVPVEVLAV